MGDQINDAERRAINEAIEAGKVRRVGRRAGPSDAPAVDWENIPRRSVSRSFDRTPAKRHYGGDVSVREILEWAFRVEQAQLELPRQHEEQIYARGFGMEYVMIQRAMLGCQVQGGGSSEPHEDAEAVAAIVANLTEKAGGLRMAIRVSEFARAGREPDCMADVTPRIEPVEWQTTAYGRKAKAQTLEEIKIYIKGKLRPRTVQWCPVMLIPSHAVIARARADYRDWWFALSEIRRNLQASGMLRTFTVNDRMPAMEPWVHNC